MEVKYELGLIYKELGKTEEALQLLREISATNQEFLAAKGGATVSSLNPGPWQNRPNQEIKTGG